MTNDLVVLRTISLGAAQRVFAAGMAKAEELGLAVCITVADVGGEPVLTGRMDGAPRLSAVIAADKAWTVTAFAGVPTAAWWDIIKDEPALIHGITKVPRLTIFGGGVPLLADGEVVGAVGVSGGSSAQDAEIAIAATQALNLT